MNMNALGFIFADSVDGALNELTEKRTLGAVPFGARYRVIDFLISNMANAGIRNIGIATTGKYDSLMHHVRSGAPWDLDRKRSRLTFLPPYASFNGGGTYENRLEALQYHLQYLKNFSEEYIIISGCNYVANIDFNKILEYHKSTGARITALYRNSRIHRQQELSVMEYKIGEDGRILDHRNAEILNEDRPLSINAYVMRLDDLIDLAERSLREGKHSFRRDLFFPMIDSGEKVMGYEVPGAVLYMDDLSTYLKNSLELLNKDVRDNLFHVDGRPILTNVKDSAPARYGDNAKVVNSLIADGTIIEGEVRNSIIFRGVRIGKDSVVENSVIMQESTIGDGVRLNYAVLDKNVIVQDCRMLSGYITHPFYMGVNEVI